VPGLRPSGSRHPAAVRTRANGDLLGAVACRFFGRAKGYLLARPSVSDYQRRSAEREQAGGDQGPKRNSNLLGHADPMQSSRAGFQSFPAVITPSLVCEGRAVSHFLGTD
jgi:hypothetical protein